MIRIFFFILSLILGCSGKGGMVLELSDISFNEEVLNSDRTVVVDFYAPWCGPCRVLAPRLEEWANKYPSVKFAKINVDENHNVANDCKINSLPTLIVVKNGKEVRRWIGIPPATEIDKVLSSS